MAHAKALSVKNQRFLPALPKGEPRPWFEDFREGKTWGSHLPLPLGEVPQCAHWGGEGWNGSRIFKKYKNRSIRCGFCNKKRGEEKMKKMNGSIFRNRNVASVPELLSFMALLYDKDVKEKSG